MWNEADSYCDRQNEDYKNNTIEGLREDRDSWKKSAIISLNTIYKIRDLLIRDFDMYKPEELKNLQEEMKNIINHRS